jgi:hypothetical protein
VIQQRRILEPGPWCWPDPAANPGARAHAERAVGAATPRVLAAGQVALVTIHGEGAGARGELWALSMRDDTTAGADAQFLAGARDAWLDAQCALPRALPLLWRSVREQHARLGPVSALYPAPENTSPTLDGRSFGLAFGLALASSVVGVPAPADVVATATLDELGRLGRVEGLGPKLEVIDRIALSVRRVAIATEQLGEARDLLKRLGITRLELVPFSSLSRALEHLLSDPARAIDAATRPERGELVHSFFQLALGERRASVEWAPIERAADRALERWAGDLEPDHARMLEFARAVAARHHYNKGTLTLPTPEWLSRFTLSMRLGILAHTAQQAADTGAPDPDRVLALARRACPDLEILAAPPPEDLADLAFDSRMVDACFAPHLRLLGAIGRMRYTTMGDLRGAIRDQLAVCVGWQRAWRHEETTYPLAALFTTLSALAREPGVDTHHVARLFERVEDLWGTSQRGGRRCRDNVYVRIGRGRALAALGRRAEAAAELDPLLDDLSRHAEQMRLSAARWRLRCGQGAGLGAAREVLAGSEDPRAELYRALATLDRALDARDHDAARAQAELVRAEQRELCDTLLAGAGLAPGDPGAPAFLARRYPY